MQLMPATHQLMLHVARAAATIPPPSNFSWHVPSRPEQMAGNASNKVLYGTTHCHLSATTGVCISSPIVIKIKIFKVPSCQSVVHGMRHSMASSYHRGTCQPKPANDTTLWKFSCHVRAATGDCILSPTLFHKFRPFQLGAPQTGTEHNSIPNTCGHCTVRTAQFPPFQSCQTLYCVSS